MTGQKILLKFLSSRLLGRTGQRFLRWREWTIENGEGAGLKLSFPQNLDFISGTSELPVQRALAEHIRPGNVVYDIGANVGFFSLIASKLVSSAGAVYTFEPVSENGDSINRNITLNRLQNVRFFEVAVGGSSGSADLFLTDWDGGSTLSTSAVKTAQPLSRRTVRVVALDSFIQAEGLRRPDFVKIDVEGVELELLEGMSGTLAETKPVLLYEIDDGDRASFERRWKELDTYVAEFGYTIRHLENSYSNADWHVGHTLALPRNKFKAH
jgi:FkbM family methyltransferase